MRRNLQGQGRQDDGLRRLRQFLRRARRPRPRFAAVATAHRESDRRRQGRRRGLCEASRLRRSRQGPPVDEDRRSGYGEGNPADRKAEKGRRRIAFVAKSLIFNEPRPRKPAGLFCNDPRKRSWMRSALRLFGVRITPIPGRITGPGASKGRAMRMIKGKIALLGAAAALTLTGLASCGKEKTATPAAEAAAAAAQ